jgi:hypothetical protein
MSGTLQFPDRGKGARGLLGARLSVVVGRGSKCHRAAWYHVTLGDTEGACLETDCGRSLEFRPFDGSTIEAARCEWREAVESGDYCGRCVASIGAMIAGRSRKRAFRAPAKAAPRKKPETFEERREERLRDKFFRACFGVSAAEADRRGVVQTGKGRKARYRLGDYDGSEGPAA